MRTLLFAVHILVVPFLFFVPAAEAATCVGGVPSHTATAEEAASVPGGAIIAGLTQVCPGDAQIGINADVGQAKQYLESLPRSGTATDNTNVDKLNDAFAVCTANFLKAYQQKYGPVTISSAYRSSEYDAKMCVNNSACGALMNNPAPNGNHQKGLAIDVWQGAPGSTDNQQIKKFAAANPQFGVCFPLSWDRPHMILAGIPSNEAAGCRAQGVMKACDAAHFDPNSIQGAPSNPAAPSSATPTAQSGNFGDLIRQYLGGQQPQTSAVPATGAQSSPTSLSAPTSQPSAESAPSSTASPASTGVPNNTPIAVSESPATIAVPNGLVSDTLGSPEGQGGTSTSVFDLIGALASPSATPAAPAGSPLALNNGVQSKIGTNAPVPVDNAALQPGAYTLAPAGTQTFTSQDLQYAPSDAPAAPSTTSLSTRLLSALKQVLVAILGWFAPPAPQPIFQNETPTPGFEG